MLWCVKGNPTVLDTKNQFSKFNLLPSLTETLNEKEIQTPTEIQLGSIPALLEGKTIVGLAETGSGKTLAYVLPILHLLKTRELAGDSVSEDAKPRALVVVPSRDLGEQVSKVFKPFTHTTRLRVRTLLGGTTFEIARRSVKGKFEILVATPGRLVKLLEMGLLNLEDTETLIFDEADQMVDKSFLSDAKKIVEACSKTRKLGLFTATLSNPVQKIIKDLFSDAITLKSKGSHRMVETLKTENITVVDGKRFPLLEEMLSKKQNGSILIFTNTREQCDKLSHLIKKSGNECVIYRGEMEKVERRSNLKSFRDGTVRILVSTDLGGRGLDIPHVETVINYHLPKQMENYIHRVGRTARAGRSGKVINFVTERDEEILVKIKQSSKSDVSSEWAFEPEHKKDAPRIVLSGDVKKTLTPLSKLQSKKIENQKNMRTTHAAQLSPIKRELQKIKVSKKRP